MSQNWNLYLTQFLINSFNTRNILSIPLPDLRPFSKYLLSSVLKVVFNNHVTTKYNVIGHSLLVG